MAYPSGDVYDTVIDFAVILFDCSCDLQLRGFKLDEKILEARRITRHPFRICVAGIKRDLLPCDYSARDLRARAYKSDIAYYYDAYYIPVNCATGEGVKPLCQYIGLITCAPCPSTS